MENSRWYRFGTTIYYCTMGISALAGAGVIFLALMKGNPWMSAVGALLLLSGAFLCWKPMRWAHKPAFYAAMGLGLLRTNDNELMLLLGGCVLFAAIVTGCAHFVRRREYRNAALWRL